MTITIILHNISRVVFAGALTLSGLAFLELAANWLAHVSLIGNSYAAGRLIELAAALLILVIAITLREIRDELRASRS